MDLALADLYATRMSTTLRSVVVHEREAVPRAAGIIRERRETGGFVHDFGAGHPRLVAADATYRAAGSVWVNGVRDQSLSVSRGTLASSPAEAIAEDAAPVFLDQGPRDTDVTVEVCNSGTTPGSVAWATACADRGIPAISIVSRASLAYFRERDRPSLEHSSAALIDNHCPVGDAITQEPDRAGDGTVSVGPSSTMVNAPILDQLLVHLLEHAIGHGEEAETTRSGHLDGARASDETLIEAYRGRIGVY